MSAAAATIPLAPRPRPRVKPDAPRRFDLEATERAVETFEQAQRFEQDAWHAEQANPSLGKWASIASKARQEAEEVLLTTILAWGEDVRDADLSGIVHRHHPGRGVRIGARVYFALPDPQVDPGHERDDIPTMRLAVLDAASIISPETK